MELPKLLRGIVTPMVTPLSAPDDLDGSGLEQLIEHILAGGVSALFVLGTTGEGPSLSYRLRGELIRRTVDQTAGRVPVLVGVTDTAAEETVAVAKIAQQAGASAVVMAPPYYFSPSQAELAGYFRSVVRRCTLPVFIYNIPSQTKVVIGRDALLTAMEEPNVVGFKDSGGDMKYFHMMMSAVSDRPDFSMLVGPEELLAEAMMLGAHGGVSGGSNVNPRLFVSVVDAVQRKDFAAAAVLHRQIIEMSDRLYGMTQYSSAFLAGIKCALSCLGICEDVMALPHRRLEGEDRLFIQKQLAALGLLEPATSGEG